MPPLMATSMSGRLSPSRLNDFLLTRIQFPVPNILRYRPREHDFRR